MSPDHCQTPKVGAGCGKAACPVLFGERSVLVIGGRNTYFMPAPNLDCLPLMSQLKRGQLGSVNSGAAAQHPPK